MKNRLGLDFDVIFADLGNAYECIKNIEDAGFCVYSSTAATAINEYLSGGCSMPKFMRGLYKMPDKVEKEYKVSMAK